VGVTIGVAGTRAASPPPLGRSHSSVSSSTNRLQIRKTFKGNELLKGVTWECLVGVNGAGKTTQLQILLGNVEADSGEILKARRNLHIAYLNQEFDINPERTVRQELAAAYEEGMAVLQRTEEIQKELEECTDDMDRMSALLDELDKLSNKAVDLDMNSIDKKLDQMMPQLGFSPEDNNRCCIDWN
jgi:ATPase subunit of ABC transporter with duplicated ATPase domains